MCVVVLSAEVRVGASTYERLESYLMAMLDVRTVRVHNFAQLCTTLHNFAQRCKYLRQVHIRLFIFTLRLGHLFSAEI